MEQLGFFNFDNRKESANEWLDTLDHSLAAKILSRLNQVTEDYYADTKHIDDELVVVLLGNNDKSTKKIPNNQTARYK